MSLPDPGAALSLSQDLRALQRKLEEQEAALLGRTQVAELLQQELHTAEQQNQVPLHALLLVLLSCQRWMGPLPVVQRLLWEAPSGQVLELQVCVHSL